MGEIERLTAASTTELHSLLVERIRSAQRDDPLAPITLLVDSPALGWQLRRQLISAWPHGSGVANLRTSTPAELLSALADEYAITAPGQIDPTLRSAAVATLLRSDTGALNAVRDHADTAVRLDGVLDELLWCSLDRADIAALGSRGVSATAQASISFATVARDAMSHWLGEPSWPHVAATLAADIAKDAPRSVAGVVSVASRLPAPVVDVLEALAAHCPVTLVTLEPTDSSLTSEVMSCPDPSTEAALAVRLAAQAVIDGVPAHRVAILYSADLPYARLLDDSLAAAGLEWHGPAGTTLSASAVSRSVLALAAMATERANGGSGITRPALMRWFSAGRVHTGADFVSAGTLRRLIRTEALFGDAVSWLPTLHGLTLAPLGSDEEVDGAHSPARIRAAKAADDLSLLITALDSALATVNASTSWSALGASLWSALESLRLQGLWWRSDAIENASVAAVRSVLLESLPGIDSLQPASGIPAMPADASGALDVLMRALSGRRGAHGSPTAGIHVGPVAASGGLAFDRVILVGAAEGLLPTVRTDDPLLPLAARELLRRTADDLPSATDAEAALARTVRAVCASAQRTTALLSRGALAGRAAPTPSRYLRIAKNGVSSVDSLSASLVIDPPPLDPAAIRLRAALGSHQPPADLAPMVDSMAAWRTPRPGPHFGLTGLIDGAPVWSLHRRHVSASAIESFLHCPYNYFVTRVLGISTDDHADEIDVMRPHDRGLMLHRVLEQMVRESLDAGTLPRPGEPWPAATLDRLKHLLADEIARATADGRTGWAPSWKRHRDIMATSLPSFLDCDDDLRGSEPPTTTVAVEFGFGREGGLEVPFRLDDGTEVLLRGDIDRLDASSDGRFVRVVDYKTGASTRWSGDLGITGERAKVQDLVYGAAARVLHPQADEIGVAFIFVPNVTGDCETLTADHEPDREAALRALLSDLQTAGTEGRFLPAPRGHGDYCEVCKRLGRRAELVAGAHHDEDGDE